MKLGLENNLLRNCIFDISLTNDTSFLEQQSLKLGKPGTIIYAFASLISFPEATFTRFRRERAERHKAIQRKTNKKDTAVSYSSGFEIWPQNYVSPI